MESLNCSKGNTVGIVVAYFLIYVVWGSTYFFIGVALKDFSPFLLGALRFTDYTSGNLLFAGRTNYKEKLGKTFRR